MVVRVLHFRELAKLAEVHNVQRLQTAQGDRYHPAEHLLQQPGDSRHLPTLLSSPPFFPAPATSRHRSELREVGLPGLHLLQLSKGSALHPMPHLPQKSLACS